MKLISSSRSVTLPHYTRDGFQELITPNEAKVITQSGRLGVDHYNTRGGWRITFDTITAAEYSDLRAVYDDQVSNEEFLTFDRTGLSGDLETVYMSMPPERNIVWNQQAVKDLAITLEPRNASS